MTSATKTFLGILSFASVILLGIWTYTYIQWLFNFLPNVEAYEGDPNRVFEEARGLIVPTLAFALPAGLISLFLLVYYIIQVVNNKAMDTAERIVWIATLIIFCPLTFPIYWAMRVRTLPSRGVVAPIV